MTTTATKTYEGTKRVHAHPMNRGDYNAYRGWEAPHEDVRLLPHIDMLSDDWMVLA